MCVSYSVVSDSLWPHGLEPTRLLCSWDSPSKNTGVGRHSLLQGISRPRDRTQISCNVGRFITVWATRKAHFIGEETNSECRSWSQVLFPPHQGEVLLGGPSLFHACECFVRGLWCTVKEHKTGGQTYLGLKVGSTLRCPVLLADYLTALSFHFTYQVEIQCTF